MKRLLEMMIDLISIIVLVFIVAAIMPGNGYRNTTLGFVIVRPVVWAFILTSIFTILIIMINDKKEEDKRRISRRNQSQGFTK